MLQGSVDLICHDDSRTKYERKTSNLDAEVKIIVTPTARQHDRGNYKKKNKLP